MAKHPHTNDDQAPQPADVNPKPPKPVVPNMSIDEPEEAPLEVEEVFEDDIPVVAAAPASDLAEFVLADEADAEEVVAEEVPFSGVVLADEEEDALVEALAEEDVLAAEAVEEEPLTAAPASEVDLSKMFDEAPAPTASTAATYEPYVDPWNPDASEPEAPSFAETLATASAPIAAPVAPSMPMDELTAAAVPVDEDVFEEPLAEAAPASEVLAADEVVEEAMHAPASEIIASDDHVHAAPMSEVIASEEHVHVAPASEIMKVAEPIHSAPASDIAVSHEVAEPAPASAVVAAAPASDVWAAEEVEEVEEVAEAAPASDVLAAEEVEEFAEAMPESAVMAAEEVEEIAEATPESDVLFDEAIAEAASELKSAEVAEEVAEAVEEPSSATRKAEGVLDDEVAEEVGSAAELFEDATEEVLDAEEAEAVEADSAAVLFDEAVEEASAVEATSAVADFDQTMAFETPASAAKKANDDALITEEEFAGPSEASAVNLGEMPGHKGSSVTGIDKVAEALESGIDVESDHSDPMAATVPSVEFDELLDEDIDAKPVKKKKPVATNDEFTEMDAEAIDENLNQKRGKAAAKATGDDIDLDALFAEDKAEEAAEAVEAVDAEEAVELDAEEAADATEAFDAEEAEALEDDDVKPKKTKMGAKTSMHDDDEDIDATVGEDEEDVSAKKKKGKDKKGKKDTTVAPAPAQSSTFLRVFIGMVLAGIILVGAAAGGLFLAPAEVRDLVNQIDPPKPVPPPPPKPKLALAHEAMDKNDYDGALAALDAATAPDEYTVRGEARWLKYLKVLDKGVPDAAAPEVDTAVKDLTKGSDKVLLAHVENTLQQKALRDEITETKKAKEAVDKVLAKVTAEKVVAEKNLDVAETKLDAAADVLVKGKHIDDKGEFSDVVLAKILKALTEKEGVLDAVNKILDTEVKAVGVKGVEDVVAKKKDAEDKVAAVDKVLAKETKTVGDKGVLEIIGIRNKLTDTIKDAIKELAKGQIVIDKLEPRDQLLDGIAVARQKAESPLSTPLAQLGMSLGNIGTGTSSAVAQTFSTAKLATELGWFQGREKFIETPQQKMSTYVTLLQDRQQKDAARLKAITIEAEWVVDAKSKSDTDARGKALYVQGLALRNEGNFAEAWTKFDETIKMIPGGASWGAQARKSHKELLDPNEYYVPRIKDFLAAGNADAALAEANIAIKAIHLEPAKGVLFIHRGLIRLDLLQAKGAKIPEDKQAEIRADADEATKKDASLAGESLYLHGLLEERLENWTKAEELFTKAIDAVKDRKDMANESAKYRLARGRLLLREPTEAPTPAPADNDKQKKDDARLVPQQRTIVLHPWSALVVSALIAQPEDIDADEKIRRERLNKAIEDANELIKSDDKVLKGKGLLLRGQAKSQLGERTEGLKEYAEGLNLLATTTKITAKEIAALVLQIENHPAFQRPDAAAPNPLLAERHFGEGLHYYWSMKYPQAEGQFKQALKYYPSDARYEYFLGLAQYHQKSRKNQDDAKYSFEQGAIKEAKAAANNPDAIREVNASLERIQGELRQHLNTYRYKAQAGEPDAKK